MSKVVLDIDSKNVDTVLMILKNLKSGLIKNISIDNKKQVSNLDIQKEKRVLVEEDEFLAKKAPMGKYSKEAYKSRLLNKKS